MLSLGGCQWVVSELAEPGGPQDAIWFESPENHSQFWFRTGSNTVSIGLDGIDEESLRVTLYARGDLAHGVDVTDEFSVSSHGAEGNLGEDRLADGFAYLVASATVNSAPVDASVAFSWEGALSELEDQPGCEFLGQSRCLLPFPSDTFTVADATMDSGRRVNFVPGSLGSNTSGTPIDVTEWNRNDGFSPGSPIVVHVPGVDLDASGIVRVTDIGASLDPDSAVVLLDAVTGEKIPHFVDLDGWGERNQFFDEQALIIRPAVNFTEGHRIIVALRHLVDTAGDPISPSREFEIYRDEIPTYIPKFELRRPAMREILHRLDAAGVARDDLYLAWDFTVASQRNLTERMLHMRDDAYEQIDNGTPGFLITSVQDNVSTTVQRRIRGTVDVPLYLTGTGAAGSRLVYGPDDLPERNGTYAAEFVCNVPKSVLSATGEGSPGRGVAYGHGLLGSRNESNSFGALINNHQMVLCAMDWIGMASEDIPNVAVTLNDLSNFATLPDRLQQSMLNFQFLARLMKEPSGFVTDPAFQDAAGDPLIQTGAVFFNGNSQGGIMGGAATAISKEWTRAALGVPAMNYANLLTRSVHWDSFSPVLFAAYPDPVQQAIGYSLIQMLWDRGEANGYAAHLTDDPLPNTPEHQVLLIEAFGDHQVANVATEIEARTIGAKVYAPALADGRSTDVNPMWGIDPVPSFPFDGSVLVVWDFGTPGPPTTNLPPRPPTYGSDPHGKGGAEPRVAQQVSDFLRVDGFFADICGGLPCQSAV